MNQEVKFGIEMIIIITIAIITAILSFVTEPTYRGQEINFWGFLTLIILCFGGMVFVGHQDYPEEQKQ